MFVYSVRATTLKFFGVIGVSHVCLIALIVFVPSSGGTDTSVSGKVSYQYEKIRSDDDVENFLAQFGYEVADEAEEKVEVKIPDEFDRVFASYNGIQKRQGLNLAKYKRKTVTRYTYSVNNYDGYDGKVLANVLVYRGKVVGGDICSADAAGFVHGFEK